MQHHKYNKWVNDKQQYANEILGTWILKNRFCHKIKIRKIGGMLIEIAELAANYLHLQGLTRELHICITKSLGT